MTQATITTAYGTEQVPFPDSWADLTFAQYTAIVPVYDKPDEVIAALLDGDISNVPAASLERLRLAISFLYDTQPGQATAPVYSISVARAPWQKLIKAQQLIQNAEGRFADCAVQLARIYTGDNIAHWPVADGLAQAWHIWEGINEFVAQYEELGRSNLTPEEEAAMIMPTGEQAFEQFGWFASVVELAECNPLEYDAMLRQAAVTVYQTLLYQHRRQYVQNKVRKIQQAK